MVSYANGRSNGVLRRLDFTNISESYIGRFSSSSPAIQWGGRLPSGVSTCIAYLKVSFWNKKDTTQAKSSVVPLARASQLLMTASKISETDITMIYRVPRPWESINF